jgi:hypothetical protein
VDVLIAMDFPIDLEGTPQTLSGTIHRIDGPLAFLSLTAGVILVSRRFKQDEKWRPFHRLALILALVMLAAFIGMFLSIYIGAGFAGLCQRIGLAAWVTWVLLALRRILVAQRQRGPSKPWMQLFPRSVCVREPLAHLLIGESIDLTTCVPLVKDI